RAISSAGRAPPRQGGGHWFEPSIAHSDRCRGLEVLLLLLPLGAAHNVRALQLAAGRVDSGQLQEVGTRSDYVTSYSLWRRTHSGVEASSARPFGVRSSRP